MKTIGELILSTDITNKPQRTQEEYQKVTDFVASVYSLFAEFGGKIREEEFFKNQCRRYADKILILKDYHQILERIEKVVSVPNFPRLVGNYRTPESVLNIACNAPDHLTHDYYQIFPQQQTNDALLLVEQSLSVARNPEIAKNTINNLKNLF